MGSRPGAVSQAPSAPSVVMKSASASWRQALFSGPWLGAQSAAARRRKVAARSCCRASRITNACSRALAAIPTARMAFSAMLWLAAL